MIFRVGPITTELSEIPVFSAAYDEIILHMIR